EVLSYKGLQNLLDLFSSLIIGYQKRRNPKEFSLKKSLRNLAPAAAPLWVWWSSSPPLSSPTLPSPFPSSLSLPFPPLFLPLFLYPSLPSPFALPLLHVPPLSLRVVYQLFGWIFAWLRW
ncbi:unnamed protein product, partial [Prunus brigantina]